MAFTEYRPVKVGVAMPYAPSDDERRNRLAEFTILWWREQGYDVTLGTVEHDGQAQHFRHAVAINNAVDAMSDRTDIVIVADADTLPTGMWEEAVQVVAHGSISWALPAEYWQLKEEPTDVLLATVDSNREVFITEDDAQWIGSGISWAGIQIVRYRDFLDVGGWDERFTGWGSDDACFGLKLDTLVGAHFRFPGAAWHLWHEQSPANSSQHEGWGAQQELLARHRDAIGNREAMWELAAGSRQR